MQGASHPCLVAQSRGGRLAIFITHMHRDALALKRASPSPVPALCFKQREKILHRAKIQMTITQERETIELEIERLL